MSLDGCPVPSCGAERGRWRLMCRPHWHQVPPPLRAKVWATWHHRQLHPRDLESVRKHRAACDAAIAAMTFPVTPA